MPEATSQARYSIRLAKADFKFSAAHFTLFPDRPAELLHGHNYRVRVDLYGDELDATGLLVDIAAVKRQVRARCARLDERTLLPAQATSIELLDLGSQIELRIEGRCYRLPHRDVLQLPLENVSMERLARLLWEEIADVLVGTRVSSMTLTLDETAGQSASYRGAIR